IKGFREAESPGIVAEISDQLELRAVRAHAPGPLQEVERGGPGFTLETAVAHRPPDVIVEAITQIARAGMRVADSPAGIEDLSYVGLAIPVGVLEVEHFRDLRDDHSAV